MNHINEKENKKHPVISIDTKGKFRRSRNARDNSDIVVKLTLIRPGILFLTFHDIF